MEGQQAMLILTASATMEPSAQLVPTTIILAPTVSAFQSIHSAMATITSANVPLASMATVSPMETASSPDPEMPTATILPHQESAVNATPTITSVPTQDYVLLSILSAGLLTSLMETVLLVIQDTQLEMVLVEFQPLLMSTASNLTQAILLAWLATIDSS